MNQRADIGEDIKHYRKTFSYASSKVDYSAGENIYMLPGDMNISIRSGTVGYKNKILISDGNFSLGKNGKVNTFELAKGGGDRPKIIHKVVVQPTITHKILSHEEEKLLDTFSSRWFCDMAYVSVNGSLGSCKIIS